jgi:hypothetical protein
MAKREKATRPVRFDPAVAAEICTRLAAGETLRAICRDRSLPTETVVRGWVIDRPRFAADYERAREIGYAALADQLLEIADDSSADTYVDDKGKTRPDAEAIQRSRLRIDTRKWLLAKILPRMWGDRPEAQEGVATFSLLDLVLGSYKPRAKAK